MGNPTDLKFGLRSLSYMELRSITVNFSKANLLGTGYHWKVYRGIIEQGKDSEEALEVTVKTWDDPVDEDLSYFEDEMKLLTCQSVSCNPIMPKLFGYCSEERILALVYDLASICTMNDKLDDVKVKWLVRVKGALAIARGLEFLHEQQPPFILRNLEPGNIMLDKNLNPKLFDFGLGSGGIFGDRTGAYLHVFGSDEFKKFHTGHSGMWSTASDVFDFGILLLALLNNDTVFDENIHIVHLIKSLSVKQGGHPLIAGKECNEADLCSASDIALQCVEDSPEKRPSMKSVVAYLEGLRVLQKSAWYDRGMKYPASTYCGVPNFKQPISLSSKDLETFTDNFSESNFLDQINALGDCCHGKVYRGMIKRHADCEAEQEVLVKIWDDPKYGVDYFEDEMMFLTLPSMTCRPNLVKLIGYCREDGLLGLVYELAPLCTLRSVLCDVNFSWAHRVKAALGISHALAFLHGQNPPFIHRNLDTAHIMLDKGFNPRLYHFALGSGGILGDRVTYYPRFYGAWGLMDPVHIGKWNTSCDVYAFGVILLSLISTRFVVDSKVPDSEITFWASGRKRSDIVNKRFRGTPGYYSKDASNLTELALRCTTEVVEKRPTMQEVVSVLDGLIITPKLVDSYGSIPNGVSGTCSSSRDPLEVVASVTTHMARRDTTRMKLRINLSRFIDYRWIASWHYKKKKVSNRKEKEPPLILAHT